MSFYVKSPLNRQSRLNTYDQSTAGQPCDLQQSQKLYEELLYENLRLKQERDMKRIGRSYRVDQSLSLDKKINFSRTQQPDGDSLLWNLIERNQYLEQKITKLKKTYTKQNQVIKKIENSEKWDNKFKCSEDKCYQQKYMQLLRVRSPFF